jgi:type I restriction enzyme S subunit
MTRAYSAYRDSGFRWIGEVPSHWLAVPLKRGFRIVGGSTPRSEEPSYWDGCVLWVTPADLSNLPSLYVSESARQITDAGLASCGSTLVPAGAIVLSTRAPIGSLAIAGEPLCTNQGCKALVPRGEIDSLYFTYVLLANKAELNRRGRGSTFLELSGDELGSLHAPLPPLPEQRAIAGFLDIEVGKIDALVEEQRRLIALLAEKRRAVISHAVTRGLNPAAPLKPSGVDWLGDIPAHWEACRLKFFSDALIGLTYAPSDVSEVGTGTPVLRAMNVKNGIIVTDDLLFVEMEVPRRVLLEFGDILICSRNGSAHLVGKNALISDDQAGYAFGAFMTRLRSSYSHFIYHALNSNVFKAQMASFSTTTINQLTISQLENTIVPLPPLPEQRAIAGFLDQTLARTAKLSAEADRAVALLLERRAALISAAVTGKIDVRAASTETEAA